eukprot:768997-Prymnesium_polylepis.1
MLLLPRQRRMSCLRTRHRPLWTTIVEAGGGSLVGAFNCSMGGCCQCKPATTAQWRTRRLWRADGSGEKGAMHVAAKSQTLDLAGSSNPRLVERRPVADPITKVYFRQPHRTPPEWISRIVRLRMRVGA